MKVLIVSDIFDAHIHGATALGKNVYTVLEEQKLEGRTIRSVFDLEHYKALSQIDIFEESVPVLPYVRTKLKIDEILQGEYPLIFLDSELYTQAEIVKAKKVEVIKKTKLDSALLNREITAYLQAKNIELKPSAKKQLLSIADPISHLNILSLLPLLGERDFVNYLEETTKQSTPLFWLQLNEQSVSNQIKQWFKQVGADEVQLGLALATNQLKKSTTDFRVRGLQAMIEADRKMKSSTKIQSITAFRFALYQMSVSS